MILDHVPQTAGGFVKCAALSHTEAFRQRDLDTGDVITIPNWFKEGIGEAEVKDVHDRFLSQEVIDAKDRIFRKDRPRYTVQRASRRQVAPKRLLDDNPRILGQLRGAQPVDHGLKERRRDRSEEHTSEL